DWGPGPGGMQPDLGHRMNLMSPKFQEAGIGIVEGPVQPNTGPMWITEDFSSRSWVQPYVVGAVYQDSQHDGTYLIGEGMAGVTLTFTGTQGQGQFQVVTGAAGDYQIQLPAGSYSVVASGGGLAGPTNAKLVTVDPANGQSNVNKLLDFTP